MLRQLLMLAMMIPSVRWAMQIVPVTPPTAVTVVDGAGKPVRGAAVVVVPAPRKIEMLYMFDGNLNPLFASDFRQWRTNAAGRCHVSLPRGPGWVVAFHKQGWAHVKARNVVGRPIRLLKWATITGQATYMGKPAEGATAMVQRDVAQYTQQPDPMFYNLGAKIDARGRFAIGFIPPGKVDVYLHIEADRTPGHEVSGGDWLDTRTLDLKPGETTHVTLGGPGRPVEGSIILPKGVSTAGLHRTGDVLGSSNYPVRWTSRATFRVDEAMPGDYRLQVQFRLPVAPATAIYRSNYMRFVVPPTGGRWIDKPVKLPPVGMYRAPNRVVVGQPAMDFTVTSLTGKPIHLNDYRGKYVLLDFWATWCGPCLASIPQLRKTYDRFHNTGRFAMLSLSYDTTAAKVKTYVDAQKLPWDQVWVNSAQQPQIGEAYTDGCLPTFVLIGPRGKVLAINHNENTIESAVVKALRENKG